MDEPWRFPLTRFEAQRVVDQFGSEHKDHACIVCCDDPVSLGGEGVPPRFVCLMHRLKAWLADPTVSHPGWR